MATLPEITDLFSKLALHLQTLTRTSPTDNQEEEDDSYSIDLSISKLNQSLNLNEDTEVRVLDTSLSLLCFKAPQVFDSVIEYLVKTIVSVLSSSVSCKVLRFQKEEVLLIGSSISKRGCLEFIEVVNDIISKLDERGMPSHLLICAVARVAVSASSYRILVPPIFLDDKSVDRGSTGISKLLCCFPREFYLDIHQIPLRLLSWYLEPLTLKRDILEILETTMKRPLLYLSEEFYVRMEWRNILMCMVISPIMFTHTRALLHRWFMLTGMGSVLELLIELVSAILDIISRPTCWGIPIELGSKLPFSSAYFPYQKNMLKTLAGPLTSSSFLQLTQKISKSVFPVKSSAVKFSSIDSKSIWALAICFPDWFYFASVLLFSNNFKKNFQYRDRQTSGMESAAAAAAARYIAWILSPNSESHQDVLFDSLSKISECWVLRQIGSGPSGRVPAGYRKQLKKPKLHDVEDDLSLGNGYECQVIGLWLKEFRSIMKYGGESVKNSSSCEAKSCIFAPLNSMLFRRIPLGILIGFPSYVKEDGFELVLHYVATGKMVNLTTKNARMEHMEQNFGVEDFGRGNECTKMEAVAGACLVFHLTDIVERMSTSLPEKEKEGLDIVSQVKLRVSRYLIKCIKRLIQLNTDEDRDVLLMDIHARLERWRHQGQDMLKLCKDLDDVIKGLSLTLLS